MFYIGSNKITPGLFSKGQSSGDEVTAINYSGTSISAGDKVWLNEKANVSASATRVNNASGITYTMDTSGNFVYYRRGSYYYKYDISLNSASEISTYMTEGTGDYPYYYDEYNNIFCREKCLNGNGISDIAMMCNQDDYAIEYKTTSSYGYNLYKIDKENNFNIIKTWSISSNVGSTYSYSRLYTIIGNKLYAKTDNFNGQIGTIDNGLSSITMENRTDNFKTYGIVCSTLDNKIAIGVNKSTDGSNYKGWNGIKLLNINNDYTIGSEFVSSNSELNNLLSLSPLYFTFNRETGILCISKYLSLDSSTYGMFKYENGDFTTIPLSLNNTSGQTWNTDNNLMFTSNDLSKIQFSNILFKLQQTADGTYKAIPYSYAMGQQTLTGVAKTSANQGESFTAMTILPHS